MTVQIRYKAGDIVKFYCDPVYGSPFVLDSTSDLWPLFLTSRDEIEIGTLAQAEANRQLLIGEQP